MRHDIEEKVLETLATFDKTTLVIERQPDGKLRVTPGSWEGEKVILRDQVRKVAGRVHVAIKPRTSRSTLHMARANRPRAPSSMTPNNPSSMTERH